MDGGNSADIAPWLELYTFQQGVTQSIEAVLGHCTELSPTLPLDGTAKMQEQKAGPANTGALGVPGKGKASSIQKGQKHSSWQGEGL